MVGAVWKRRLQQVDGGSVVRPGEKVIGGGV